MEKHIKAARIHRALGWFGVVMAIAMAFTRARGDLDDFGAVDWASVIESFLFFMAFAALNFAVASGARACRTWARKTSKVCGVLMLIGFPVGSLAGFYLLSNNDWNRPKKRSRLRGEAWHAPLMPQTMADAKSGDGP